MSDLLTVVTGTLGDSAGHLNRMLLDLRNFTKLPFTHLVSDDGTVDPGARIRQRDVVLSYPGAVYLEPHAPPYGVSYNLNWLLEHVKTPWAFLVEDGLRASRGWLETALDAVERIGSQRWHGHPVGMMGTASLQDWHLAMAGALPGGLSWEEFNRKGTAETYSAFWGSARYMNWNDGLWCWARLLPTLRRVCAASEADLWPSPHPGHFRDLIRGLPVPEPHRDYARQLGYRPLDAWPARRGAACGWFPGAFMLVNMQAWRDVGKFRDGCTFFEGHLGIRMAQYGYLSLCLDFPPWLHYEGMGFSWAPDQGKLPRHHEPSDGPGSIFKKDFGRDGPGHADLYGIVYETFPQEEQEAVNAELAGVELHMGDAWREWL